MPLLEEGVEAPGLIRERDQIRFNRNTIDVALQRVSEYTTRLRQAWYTVPAGQRTDDSALMFALGFGAALLIVLIIVICARE